MAQSGAKRRGPKGGAPAANGARGAGSGSRSPARLVWQFVAVGLSAYVAFVLLAGWLAVLPQVAVPLLVGGYIGLCIRRPIPAAAAGATVGILGGATAALLYTSGAMIALLRHLPTWFNGDVPSGIYTDVLLPIVQASHWGDTRAILSVLSACILTGGFAAGATWLGANVRGSVPARDIVAWALVAVLCVCFLVTANRYSVTLRQQVGVEPPNGQYGYDAVIYVKTIYLMKQGTGYYLAVVRAAENDSRFMAAGTIKNDKMYPGTWWPTPSYFRQPLAFYMWKYMGRTADGVVVWSSFLSAIGLGVLYWGFARRLSVRALLVAYMAFPWMLGHGTTLNVFFPDWWAALASVIAIALLAADLPIAAMVLAFVATLFRFTALPLMAVIEVAALLLLFSKKERRRMIWVAGTGAVCAAAFVILWKIHTAAALPFYLPQTLAAAPTSSILASSHNYPYVVRSLAPTAYYMFGYGFGVVPPALLFVTALLGFLLALKDNRFAQAACSMFVVGWAVYVLVVGVGAGYWGQMYTGALVIGTAALFAALGSAPDTIANAYRTARERLAARRG